MMVWCACGHVIAESVSARTGRDWEGQLILMGSVRFFFKHTYLGSAHLLNNSGLSHTQLILLQIRQLLQAAEIILIRCAVSVHGA